MEQNLMKQSILSCVHQNVQRLTDFQHIVSNYFKQDDASCEKWDQGIFLSFPKDRDETILMEPSDRTFQKFVDLEVWTLPGVSGSFLLKTKHTIDKQSRHLFHNIVFLGVYIPFDRSEVAYAIETVVSSFKQGWKIESSIGSMPCQNLTAIADAENCINCTFMQNEIKSWKNITLDDSRLTQLQNPVKALVLQELSGKTKERLEKMKEKKAFSLTFQKK